MTHFEEMESVTSLTSDIVVFLYLVFLVLSVIMLVNILIALLTTTYHKYKVIAMNKEIIITSYQLSTRAVMGNVGLRSWRCGPSAVWSVRKRLRANIPQCGSSNRS